MFLAIEHECVAEELHRSQAVWVKPAAPRPAGHSAIEVGRQAQLHLAGVQLAASRALAPRRVVAWCFACCRLGPARDVRQACVAAAATAALHGKWVVAAVQADHAAGRLLALHLVPRLPVLFLAVAVAVERLLAPRALLPPGGVGRELLAAARVRADLH